MSENTKIEWADKTFNPWEGCTKVSAGCAHCYAETRNRRFNGGTATNWGKGAPRRRTSEANWKLPLKWNREAERRGIRFRVFCASLADWLDPEVPIEWLADLLELIRLTPHLDWLLLTKRPELFFERLEEALGAAAKHDPPTLQEAALLNWLDGWLNDNPATKNVWIGTSVEDQAAADVRIPHLLEIPAAVRFLSCEPLLGQVKLIDVDEDGECYHDWLSNDPAERIDWVICGGESGPNARPMNPDWARSLRDQCAAAGVPFFLKQLGANVYTTEWADPLNETYPATASTEEVAKGLAAYMESVYALPFKNPKGGDMSEWPEDLQVREFPVGKGGEK